MAMMSFFKKHGTKTGQVMTNLILTLSVPTYFRHFCHLQKIGCNSAALIIKTQTIHQIKAMVYVYLLVDLIFETTYEKFEESRFENSVF